jgi:hypothetical protein
MSFNLGILPRKLRSPPVLIKRAVWVGMKFEFLIQGGGWEQNINEGLSLVSKLKNTYIFNL